MENGESKSVKSDKACLFSLSLSLHHFDVAGVSVKYLTLNGLSCIGGNWVNDVSENAVLVLSAGHCNEKS